MTDVVLFRPKYYDYNVESTSLPFGLLHVASTLIKEGYTVRIIDEVVNLNWQNIVLSEIKRNPLIFGVSSMTGKQIKYGLIFSKFVKKHSDVPVVWGGIHASLLPKQTLENENIDFVVKGEGEETIAELVKALETRQDLRSIRGLGFKQGNMMFVNKDRPLIKLDTIPDIPYDLIDINHYIYTRFAERTLEMCTSRGCQHNCTFCYNLNFNKHTWRSPSVDNIFDNLHEIIHKFKIDRFFWIDDNFFGNKKRVNEIAKKIIREKIDIKWQANCRVDYIYNYNQKFINILKKSGCDTLVLGVESGSNKILRSINKGVTREQVLKVKNKLIKNKIYQDYLFMMAFPDETNKDMMQTINLIYRLINKNKFFGNLIGPTLYTPCPGTDLYDESLRKGFQEPKNLEGWIKADWEKLNINIPWLSVKRRRFINNLISNMGGIGMNNKLIKRYFLFKLYLLARFKIYIPCFEKNIFYQYHNLKN